MKVLTRRIRRPGGSLFYEIEEKEQSGHRLSGSRLVGIFTFV